MTELKTDKGIGAGDTAGAGWYKTILCRYHNYGMCSYGDNCRYSHDLSKAKPDNICRYYLHGGCSYGDLCRYDHVRVTAKPKNDGDSFGAGSAPDGSSKSPRPNVTPGHSTHSSTSAASSSSKSVVAPCATLKPKDDDKSSNGLTQGAHTDLRTASSPPAQTQTADHCTSSPIAQEEDGISHGRTSSSSLNANAPEFSSHTVTPLVSPARWVDAPVFVPSSSQSVALPHSESSAAMQSAADVVTNTEEHEDMNNASGESSNQSTSQPISFAVAGDGTIDLKHLVNEDGLCKAFYDDGDCDQTLCLLRHGLLCELCQKYALDAENGKQRAAHMKKCENDVEQQMIDAFRDQRSRDKACGVCMEKVYEKKRFCDRRFGILNKCDHVFCLQCIRTWRGAKTFEDAVTRGCPECRVRSDFVTPSTYWFETKEEKDQMIDSYKTTLSRKHCRYFKRGKEVCPFNEKCFYMHAFENGQIATASWCRKQAQERRSRQAGQRLTTLRLNDLFSNLELVLDNFGDFDSDDGVGYGSSLSGNDLEYEWMDWMVEEEDD